MLSARVHNCLPGALYSKSDQRILKLKTVLVRGGGGGGGNKSDIMPPLTFGDYLLMIFLCYCSTHCATIAALLMSQPVHGSSDVRYMTGLRQHAVECI